MEYQERGMGKEVSEIEEPGTRKPKGAPRKRVSQACDRCRSRKDKCDGKRPTCTTCTINGRACSYDVNVKKRGLPEGYVRGLEKLWGLAIREVKDVEEHMLLVINSGDGNDTLISVWNDEIKSDNLVEAWRKSQISQELERLLSNIEPSTENGKRKRTESDSKPGKKLGLGSSLSQPLNLLPAKSDSQKPSSSSYWHDGEHPDTCDLEARDSPIPWDAYEKDKSRGSGLESILNPYSKIASADSTEVPDLPSETWHLLDVYFSYTHNWFPILEKHDVLRTSYQYSQNKGSVPRLGNGSGEHAALWAAIAYAKLQHRTINNLPRAQGPIADMVWTAERMYSHARDLIPNEEGVFELGHVQALLILALTNMGMGYLGRAWFLVGQAVRAATFLGLDRPQDDILKAFSKSRSKHVFLGCFVLDTIIAARFNHRPHLRSDDVELVGLIEEDGLEEWDPWADCLTVRRGSQKSRGPASVLSTFNRLVQVLQVLNEAACMTHDSRKLQLSIGLLEKLHFWSSTQSSPLYFDTSAINTGDAMSLLPHHYNLHIAYFATLVTSQLLSYGQGSGNLNLEPCTRSAQQIVELLRQHSNSFGFLIIPPTFEYFTKTAYDVVREVSTDINYAQIQLDGWKYNLDKCLDSMEPVWPIFESFKSSSLYITHSPMSHDRRESQVAFDLISGLQSADTPISGKTPSSMTNYDAITPFTPQVYRPQPTQATAPMSTSKPLKMGSPVSTRRASFGQSSNQNRSLHSQESPQGIFNGNPIPWPRTAALGQGLQPREGAEMDPTFNEFAALDATEWTGNWDQSLVNLGFTDRDNMDQDFYVMSREPDPLFPNNVFQQLVANSNAEATDFLDGSMFGGVGMGEFGMGFGDENEGIEAGQILQALSAAGDQRVARGDG